MSDPRISKLADILVNYSTKVKTGDWVLVTGDVIAMPLITEVVAKVLQAGGNPTPIIGSDELTEITIREANEDQLKFVSPIEKLVFDEMDVFINLRATGNTRALMGADNQKTQLRQNARRELMGTYMRRAAEGSLRWTLTQFPCHAYAQDADMSLRDYEDFVYGATYANLEDPVAEWMKFEAMQDKLVNWLKGKKQVTVKGPNIELSLSIDGRTFVNACGHANMPDGEIFTGPVEDSVNGWVKFTYPAIRGGREVEGVELEFKDGKVVNARAKKNEDYLLSQLDSDAGARFLGEFAIGTNYGIDKFTKSILFDEKIGGTLHMAVGAGYPETGSKNVSSVHWDFICDMRTDSEIYVDGDLLYKNGQFQVL